MKKVLLLMIMLATMPTVVQAKGLNVKRQLEYAVSIAHAAKSQVSIYYRGLNGTLFVPKQKYSAKSDDFPVFCCIFAMSMMNFSRFICIPIYDERGNNDIQADTMHGGMVAVHEGGRYALALDGGRRAAHRRGATDSGTAQRPNAGQLRGRVLSGQRCRL